MKQRIRRFAAGMEIDDVGFAAASDYRSPLSPPLESIFPGARSIVVLAYKELDGCDSPDLHIAMNGRLDLMEFSRSCNYKLSRHLERSFGARAMTVPASYPMAQNEETKGAVGQVSLRHAAVAAGLGAFGSNNLVVHPPFRMPDRLHGDPHRSRDRPGSSRRRESVHCLRAVRTGMPGKSAGGTGSTRRDEVRADQHAVRVERGGPVLEQVRRGSRVGAESDVRDPNYWRLYQAGYIGPQYFCFACMNVCPVGRKATA